jgi:hypothetical protein
MFPAKAEEISCFSDEEQTINHLHDHVSTDVRAACPSIPGISVGTATVTKHH